MTDTPQLSMGLTTYAAEDPGTWTHVLERAQLYDRAGVDRLVVSDHVVYGENLDAYSRPELGGAAGGKQPTGPDGCWLEPMTTLTAISSITSRVRLGTNILLAALRRPVVLAKTAATLDALSGGRLDLGVGVGWQREEYEAAGLDFSRRGRLLDHTLAVCQTLWREQRASFDGDGLRFEAIHQMPKPAQPGGVPIWVSGRVNANVARRLARFGSAWIPWGEDAADVATSIPRMRDAVAAAGGGPESFGVVGTLRVVRKDDGSVDVNATVDAAPALAAAGVTDMRCMLPLREDPRAFEASLHDLVSAFRSAVGRSNT